MSYPIIPFLAESSGSFNDFISSLFSSDSMDFSTPITERLSMGVEVLALGMAVVFSVLMIIWGVLVLFRIFFHDLPAKRRAKPSEAVTAALNEAPEAVSANANANANADAAVSSDDEIAAAITAAIAVYMGGSSASGFRVVSLRKKN